MGFIFSAFSMFVRKLFMGRNSDTAQISRRLNRGAGLFPSSESRHTLGPRAHPVEQVAAGSLCVQRKWSPGLLCQLSPPSSACLGMTSCSPGLPGKLLWRRPHRNKETGPQGLHLPTVGRLRCANTAVQRRLAGLHAGPSSRRRHRQSWPQGVPARMWQSWAEEGLVSSW